MKKILISTAAAVCLMGAASFANAGVLVNANVDDSSAVQAVGTANQQALAVAFAVGSVNNSNLTSTGVNALQIADVEKTMSVAESAGDNGGAGNLDLSGVNQTVTSVAQSGLALAAGGQLNSSTLSATMDNIAQDATIKVNVSTNH